MSVAIGRPYAEPTTDRRFYLFMSSLIAATAIVGFAPSSAGILSGGIPTPPLVVHLHAAAMVSWLLLLVVQASLVTSGRRDLHIRLGLVSLGLVPAILVLAAMTTVVRYYDGVEAGAGALVANIVFLQLRFLIMFPALIIWALAVRARDSETHKRVMILASVLPIGAALARMTWVPGNDLLATFNIGSVMELALLAPALAYDLLRHGRLHRAYVIGLALTIPWMIATHFVWNTPWWRAAADALMGIG